MITSKYTTFFEKKKEQGPRGFPGPGGDGSGGGTWGTITGTLSNQTDLQSALNLKAPLASPTFTGNVTLNNGNLFLGGNKIGLAGSPHHYCIHLAFVGPTYPIRFAGADDAVTHRYFEFGHYTGDDSANAWNDKANIDSYTGTIRSKGDVIAYSS